MGFKPSIQADELHTSVESSQTFQKPQLLELLEPHEQIGVSMRCLRWDKIPWGPYLVLKNDIWLYMTLNDFI